MVRHTTRHGCLGIQLRDMKREPRGTLNQRPLRRTRAAADVARQVTYGFAQ
jgi:hypothetical protein